jgi:predicted GNAT superfamily acetyltransferase
MSSTAAKSNIVIRDIESIAEIRDVESLEKEVWECADRDIVPLTALVAVREVGGILIGAFDEATLVGFAFGFVGCEDGEVVHHSHMLAVKRSHRCYNLGYRLKLAQRHRALEQGIKRMTWTFDPLQSLNAYFNFNKLGVLSDKYKVDFYGGSTSSPLHQTGTDRLWVSWLLDSPRVKHRVENGPKPKDENRASTTFIRCNDSNIPETIATIADCKGTAVIEIPNDIGSIEGGDPSLARRWREETRRAFQEAMGSGYIVSDFVRRSAGDTVVGMYFLKLGKIEDLVLS